MNPNKKPHIVNAGDTRFLAASLNYQKLQSQDMITWKKKVYSKDEIQENPLRLLFAIEDNGDIHSLGKELSTNYKFTKQDVGKYIKFYSYCNKFNTLAQCIVFYVEGEHDTDVLITDVERIGSDSKELYVGEKIKLRTKFSLAEDRVSSKTREYVKWMVKVNGEEERLIIDGLVMTGREIEFTIPDDWAEKEVVLMPYLYEYSDDVSYQAKVKTTIKVSEIYWYGREPDNSDKRSDIMLNHKVRLSVKVENYKIGSILELTVKQSNGRKIKGNSKEFDISGIVDRDGLVTIHDFEVECDFKEDNQDFDHIEFYQKGRANIVGRLKENFGWMYVNDGNITKVYLNVEIIPGFIAPGFTIDDYKNAVDRQFKRTLELSSDGRVSGKVFFDSPCATIDLPQVTVSLKIIKSAEITEEKKGLNVVGSASFNAVEANSQNIDIDGKLLFNFGLTAVHELFHTIGIDHPQSTIQADDAELISVGGLRFETTTKTDKRGIYYNIMAYGHIIVDSYLLSDLWTEKDPEYLTKGQLNFLLEQIDDQRKGAGCNQPDYNHSDYWSYPKGKEVNIVK